MYFISSCAGGYPQNSSLTNKVQRTEPHFPYTIGAWHQVSCSLLSETGTEYQVICFADIKKAGSAIVQIHCFSVDSMMHAVNNFGIVRSITSSFIFSDKIHLPMRFMIQFTSYIMDVYMQHFILVVL
jgi:hypothetical protein